jgi:hypothetical protein
MTHNVLETAIREGIPFAINVADGRQYEVRSRDRVILMRTRIVLVDDKEIPHLLPLLTMTGVSYLPAGTDAGQN